MRHIIGSRRLRNDLCGNIGKRLCSDDYRIDHCSYLAGSEEIMNKMVLVVFALAILNIIVLGILICIMMIKDSRGETDKEI